jgi:uncharacterized protein (TIGR03083 family)
MGRLVVDDVHLRGIDACIIARTWSMMVCMASGEQTSEAIARATAAQRRFAQMIAAAPDGNAPVPGLSWTVSELGAHVLALTRHYTVAAEQRIRGWRDLRSGPAENARMMEELAPERDVKVLAAAIEDAASEIEIAWSTVGPDEVIPWHGDVELPVATVADIVFGDAIVHTYDLSRAMKTRYRISHDDAVHAFAAIVDVAPHFVDPKGAAGFRGVYDLSLRGGPSYAFAFDDGKLTITEGKPARADCRISADPPTLLLSSERRIGQVSAALSGRVFAYGRKPWLAFKFDSLLVNP